MKIFSSSKSLFLKKKEKRDYIDSITLLAKNMHERPASRFSWSRSVAVQSHQFCLSASPRSHHISRYLGVNPLLGLTEWDDGIENGSEPFSL